MIKLKTKLYVGNLDYSTTDADLKTLFEEVGKVVSAQVVTKPMGFGFVEFASEQEADEAIKKLHGTEFKGRSLNVAHAKSDEEKTAETPTSGVVPPAEPPTDSSNS